MRSAAKSVAWVGIILVLVTGLIHAIETPEHWEKAVYVGVLFVLNAVGAVVAAVGIYRGAKSWGWGLGLLVTGGAFVMYIISRTVGLPIFGRGEWREPIGMLSLVVEGLFVLLALWAFMRTPAPRAVGPSAAAHQH